MYVCEIGIIIIFIVFFLKLNFEKNKYTVPYEWRHKGTYFFSFVQGQAGGLMTNQCEIRRARVAQVVPMGQMNTRFPGGAFDGKSAAGRALLCDFSSRTNGRIDFTTMCFRFRTTRDMFSKSDLMPIHTYPHICVYFVIVFDHRTTGKIRALCSVQIVFRFR